MPVVKRIRNRGATITVEANAEVLFMPRGDVHNWTNRFTGRIRSATIGVAPRNSRPRWAHYGKALHQTIISARPRFWGNGRDKQRVYGAVGSTARYSSYVDQGTGTFAGRGMWKAKVLPPYMRGEGSLYEATWRPGGPGGKQVKPVYIKGQRAQNFFDKGLRLAFQSMRLRSAQVAGETKIGNVLNSMPTMMENFLGGNTPADAAFRASLDEWRTWREEAYVRDDLGHRVRPEVDPRYEEKRQQRQQLREEREAALRASIEASQRRKAEQERKVREEAERRRKAAEKREAEKRAREKRDREMRENNAIRRGNADMRRQALEAFERIKAAYPDAVLRQTQIPNDARVTLYRIIYTVNGETHRLDFAYGY